MNSLILSDVSRGFCRAFFFLIDFRCRRLSSSYSSVHNILLSLVPRSPTYLFIYLFIHSFCYKCPFIPFSHSRSLPYIGNHYMLFKIFPSFSVLYKMCIFCGHVFKTIYGAHFILFTSFLSFSLVSICWRSLHVAMCTAYVFLLTARWCALTILYQPPVQVRGTQAVSNPHHHI